ncbi:hypothetical protein HDU97_001927 [Phlyctochytrium planicorne]|nr:hypothetical protein HDU97_001927 [Phlyctochytrium planicorne]
MSPYSSSEDFHSRPTSTATDHSSGSTGSKRIIIIGGGLAGLTLALALKRVARSTGINLETVIFDSKTEADYNEAGPHYLLWRWAVEILVEMGLGGKLSKIAAPILKFTSIDAETQEDLVQWPPSKAELGASSHTVEEELGVDSALPPMVATRRCDLIRLLLLALSGRRDDLVFGDDFLPIPANNNDLALDPVHGLEADLACGDWYETENFKYLVPELVLGETLETFSVHPASGKVKAIFESGRMEVGDILVGADGAQSIVRNILFHQNQKRQGLNHAGACIMSGITRLVVPPVDTPDVMENGKPIEDLHRDHVHEFCPDGRSVSVMGKTLSFGMTNLGNGLLGWNLVVGQTEPKQHVDNFNMIKTRKMVSEAIAKNPRSSICMTQQFTAPGVAPPPAIRNLTGIQTDTTNPEDKWGAPSGRTMMTVEPEDETTESTNVNEDEETLHAEDNEEEDDDADVIENLRRMAFKDDALSTTSSWETGSNGEGGSADNSPPDSPRRRRGRGQSNGAGNIAGDPDLQRRLREKLEADHFINTKPSNLKIHHRSMPASGSLPMSSPFSPSPNTSIPQPGMMPNLFAPPEPLNGKEIRTLALRLAQTVDLPHPCHAVIARTDPSMTICTEVEDLAEDPLETFSHIYQPGRVILIGDAAHVVAPQAHGSIGAGLALTDAALLAKLLAKALVGGSADTPTTGSHPQLNNRTSVTFAVDDDGQLMHPPSALDDVDQLLTSDALKQVAAEFDKERVVMATQVMKEARAEGDWGRTENGWVRSLMRFGRKLTPGSWTKSSYATMLTRGSVRSGLPSLMPVGASSP